jgi:hypothetical protein
MLSLRSAPYHAIFSVGYKLVLLDRIRLKLWLLFNEVIVRYYMSHWRQTYLCM